MSYIQIVYNIVKSLCFEGLPCLFHGGFKNFSSLVRKTIPGYLYQGASIHLKHISSVLHACFKELQGYFDGSFNIYSCLTSLSTCSSLSLSLTPSQLGQIVLFLEHTPLIYDWVESWLPIHLVQQWLVWLLPHFVK